MNQKDALILLLLIEKLTPHIKEINDQEDKAIIELTKIALPDEEKPTNYFLN